MVGCPLHCGRSHFKRHVVILVSRVVDVDQIASGHHGLVPFDKPPDLIAKEASAGLRLKFKSFLLKQGFFGGFRYSVFNRALFWHT